MVGYSIAYVNLSKMAILVAAEVSEVEILVH